MQRAEKSIPLANTHTTPMACRICGNTTANRIHVAREMMLGLGETFPYLECGACGCVQLSEIPQDMSSYYPANYYSFDQHGRFTTYLRRSRVRHAFGKFNLLGWLLTEFVVPHDAVLAIRRAGVAQNAAILDVGCGSGRLLLDLAWLGFSNLTGADPYVASDITYSTGVKVFKRRIENLEGQFDLVMLHHSFEHMEQPWIVMQAVRRLLKPGGQAIIRIPVADSFAWKNYGVNWVNLDSPRHFFLHTAASMKLLADRAGLELLEVRHEGNAEQFWASEQYAAQIPMSDPRSLKSGVWGMMRMLFRMQRDKSRAKRLNESKEGDLVCFRYHFAG